MVRNWARVAKFRVGANFRLRAKMCFNTLHAEIIYKSPFINAEIKIICLR